MIYQNTQEFAFQLDDEDPLKTFRTHFFTPKHNNEDSIYFCGNSLGLQPITALKFVNNEFNNWKELAIEAFFKGDNPWLNYHKELTKSLAAIVGANEEEVSIMNSLTVNLHLLMVSFYKPTPNRYKIIIEGGAFPSDQYAIASQVAFHGYNTPDAVIEIFPRQGEVNLRTEDILQTINDHGDELALVLFGGINYFTGQFFDITAITNAAHSVGAYAGFDLAHAAGNVVLNLHARNVDFACWCSYKYLNSGPGGISGIFVHEKHFDNAALNRFAGWWGYDQQKRFLMEPNFVADKGAAGWQVSTSPVMLLALHKAALEIFDQAGGMTVLRVKSELLTGYLEYLINEVNKNKGEQLFTIITPLKIEDRGCQLSIVCKKNAKATFNYLTECGIIGDWREPNVIRLSPVPLYNSFSQVFQAGQALAASVNLN